MTVIWRVQGDGVFLQTVCYIAILLCGCETLSVNLWTERRLTVFCSKVTRKLGPSWEEVEVGGLRNLYSDDLRNWYFSRNVFRAIKLSRMRRAGHVAGMEIRFKLF